MSLVNLKDFVRNLKAFGTRYPAIPSHTIYNYRLYRPSVTKMAAATASTVKLHQAGVVLLVVTLMMTGVSYGRVLNGRLLGNVSTVDLSCPDPALRAGVFDMVVPSEAAALMGSAENAGVKNEGMRLLKTLLLNKLPKGGRRTGASAPSKRHNSVNN